MDAKVAAVIDRARVKQGLPCLYPPEAVTSHDLVTTRIDTGDSASQDRGCHGIEPVTDHEDVAPPEVQERVTAFRQQRDEWREVGRLGEPFYVLYDAIEFPPGTCMSCGNDKRPRRPGSAMHLRCRPCLTAVEIMMAQP